MTISLKADPGGTSGAIQINGTDLLTVSTTGIQVPGDVQATSFNGGQLAGFRNLVINGQFNVWQRGTSLAAGTGIRYLADRFLTQSVGTTVAPSQQIFPTGQNQVPFNPTFFHRCVVASVTGASNLMNMSHRLEEVRFFSGIRCTLSFWAKADANKNIAVEFTQVFGSGGSTQVDSLGVTTCPLTINWQRFVVTVDFPTIAGKTVGTGSFSAINFWMDAGATFNGRTNSLGQQSGTFDIANVQFEYGPVATSFEKRDLASEITQCLRYFETGSSLLNGYAGGPGTMGYYIHYRAIKRINPIITITATSNAGSASGTNVIVNVGPGIQVTNAVTGAGNYQISSNWTADAEL